MTRADEPWEPDLDAYLAATRRQEALTAAAAQAGRERAQAVARMWQAGLTQEAIARLTGLSRPRVGQMLDVVCPLDHVAAD